MFWNKPDDDEMYLLKPLKVIGLHNNVREVNELSICIGTTISNIPYSDFFYYNENKNGQKIIFNSKVTKYRS